MLLLSRPLRSGALLSTCHDALKVACFMSGVQPASGKLDPGLPSQAPHTSLMQEVAALRLRHGNLRRYFIRERRNVATSSEELDVAVNFARDIQVWSGSAVQLMAPLAVVFGLHAFRVVVQSIVRRRDSNVQENSL